MKLRFFVRYIPYIVFYVMLYTVIGILNSLSQKYDWGLSWSKDVFDTIITLLISIAMIDVTYQIGKQQTNIQKQQYRLEKFNNYKDLHRDIYKCKCMFEAILPRIYEYFVGAEREMQNNSMDDYIEQLTGLLSDIQSRVSDAMLRGDKQLNVQAVLNLLGGVGSLLIYASQIAPRGMNTFDWRTTLVKGAEFKETLTIEEQATCISGLVKDPNLKAGIDMFVKDYKAVFEGENNILAQLQKLYNE